MLHELSLYFYLQELPGNSVLLVYLSATGVFPTGRCDYEGIILSIHLLGLDCIELH